MWKKNLPIEAGFLDGAAGDRERADLNSRLKRIRRLRNSALSKAWYPCVLGEFLCRPNWRQRLPHPIVIPKVMTMETLEDVQALAHRHLAAEFRAKDTWQRGLQLAGQRRAWGGTNCRPNFSMRLRKR